MIPPKRTQIAALALSAAAFVGLAVHEGYSDKAIQPVPGDRWTTGFGTTEGVKRGDTTTPPKALVRSLADVEKYEGAIKQCVHVPLFQYEYDAYVDLTYNIGSYAFCHSTLVVKLNREDYAGACEEILRWNRFQGKELRGLTLRRRAEYNTCKGESK